MDRDQIIKGLIHFADDSRFYPIGGREPMEDFQQCGNVLRKLLCGQDGLDLRDLEGWEPSVI